jgi:AcrR family transcriptional regulator
LKKSETSQLWIETGYELFAYEGPNSIVIEKMARQLGKNKSGFYHHFGDHDLFFEELIKHHYQVIKHFCQEAAHLQHFDPDYLNLLVKYKTAAFVQMQMRRHMNISLFKEAFNTVRSQTEKEILPLWSAYIKLPDNPGLASALWNIIRDVFFMRLTTKDLSKEFLRELVGEFKLVVESVRRMARNSASRGPTDILF